MKSSITRSSLAFAVVALLVATAAATPQFGDIFKKKKKDQPAQSEQKSESKKEDKKPEDKKNNEGGGGGGLFGVMGATSSKQTTDTTAMAGQGVGPDGKVTADAIAAQPTEADFAEVQKVANTTVKQEDLQKFVQEGNLKVRGGGD